VDGGDDTGLPDTETIIDTGGQDTGSEPDTGDTGPVSDTVPEQETGTAPVADAGSLEAAIS
jgi:hypothetical protein